MFRTFLALGGINAMLAVALGAFGAHGLKGHIADRLMAAYETGVQYHMAHALGLIAVALVADKLGERPTIRWSGRLLMTGIVLFSGSLYVMGLSGVEALGIVTPLGGVSFLAGWVLLVVSALKRS